MLEEAKEAYSEIFEVIEKHGDLCVFNVVNLKREAECHIFGLELKEKYGLNFKEKIYSIDYICFGEYMQIARWGEKYNRTISWSDDDTQPNDEVLLSVSFPTGPYIFGKDYPREFFLKFFSELQKYNPKYKDSTNYTLYYTLDNAKDIFNNLDKILDKYYKINKEDCIRRKIINLKKELDELQKEEKE
jgi:hypothetical protein